MECSASRTARGQPDLTRERFVEMNEAGSGRLYRTGDQGMWRADGILEFLGRRDDQVKIRGVRVEPGEVEAVLGEHPAVTACAVDVRSGADSDRRLVAYVVVSDATPMADLRVFLRARLPDAFVPAVIVPLPELPRTTSGKVNRAQLPDPGGNDIAPPAARPLTDTETRVLPLWKDTLGRRDIGLTEREP